MGNRERGTAAAKAMADESGNGERGKASGAGDVERSGRMAMDEADGLEALRARAVCAEVLAVVGQGHGMTTALLRRLGDLTDPERVEDANMLVAWKERYRHKITVRTKSMWGRRLRWTG